MARGTFRPAALDENGNGNGTHLNGGSKVASYASTASSSPLARAGEAVAFVGTRLLSPRPPTLWARISKYIYIDSLSDEEGDGDGDETRPLANNSKGQRRRGSGDAPSLPEAYHSVHIPNGNGNGTDNGHGTKLTWALWWRKLLAYVGPGYMVAVGYMDPGNWATDLAGGAQFGYDLLFVVLLACILAMFLQVLSLKLGVAGKRDLAQQCRASFSPRFSSFLWVTAEIAICATDLAEVIGSAIALKLLFGVPMSWGVWVTALDVLVVLALFERPNKFRILEAMVMVLIVIILTSFCIELAYSQPSLQGVVRGLLLPDTSLVRDSGKLYIAMGILGATVMPHNLYLHSSIVQTRDIHTSTDTQREAAWFGTMDTIFALSLALFVNAAILIVSAATFHRPNPDPNSTAAPLIPSVAQAYHMLAPILGSKMASVLFGVALLASGQNSTLTGTLAGQIIMEGFINVRLKPWLRRLMTRVLVILPAVVTVVWAGESGVDALLTLSQVVLSLQLPFAVAPLVLFTSDPKIVGTEFVNGPFVKALGWFIVVFFTGLNAWLVMQQLAAL